MRKLLLVALLPIVYLDTLLYKNKTLEVKYKRLQGWCNFALSLLGIKLTVHGKELLPTDESVLLISNHQGTIDTLLIISSFDGPLTFVSKSSNRKVLGIGKWGELIDIIYFDRDKKESNIYMLRQASRMIKNNRSVLIFPEGTRSKSDNINPFKAGALQPAYLAKAKIVCVTLNQSYAIDTSPTIKEVSITYHEPIAYSEYHKTDIHELAEKMRLQIQSKVKAL
jgi:1-acyl-sn-glycerol-3-phosphate acyltransferase